jgi:release factor glutamine methyltransferase
LLDFNEDEVLKLLVNHIGKPLLKRYLKKERKWRYKNFNLVILPGVFHPRFFFSTRFLADFISALDLNGKTFCEPGCGTGLVSLLAYRKGAHVIALDKNEEAVKNTNQNFALNFSNQKLAQHVFTVYESDLFDAVPVQLFDYVVINPPYFFNKVTTVSSMAWYCGENGEYFEKLFHQLFRFTDSSSRVYMVLADNCEIERICRIASKYQMRLVQLMTGKILWEKNYIFKIERK